jgi:hypothetical protein
MIGIEGTSSYGAGVTRFALKAGLEVREVIRPERSVRRRQGKSDPLDAYEAARAALSGRATAPAKSSDIESLRALHNARRSAVKARQSAQGADPGAAGHRPGHAPREVPRPHRVPADPCPGGIPSGHVRRPRLPGRAHRTEGPGPAAPAPHRRDQRSRARSGRPAPPGSPAPAATARRRRGHRRSAAGHRRRKPRTPHQRGVLRSPVRCRPGAGVLGQDNSPPTLPRR